MKEKTSSALQPGTRLESPKDTYIVDKVLGAGGFGITYRVRRLSDNRLLALKEYFRKDICYRENNSVSYSQGSSDAIKTGIKDFITEARRLRQNNIAHPNLVTIYEAFETNGTAYYSMEYVKGVNLLQFVAQQANQPLNVEQALSIMQPVLNAVATLHSKRISHLDIKHENIILSQEEDGSIRPVIIDFGLSKHYDRKGKPTSTINIIGCTDGFAPLEQYQGLTCFTPQADVYALGATLLFLLSGQWPPKSAEISESKIIAMLPDDLDSYIADAIVAAMRNLVAERTPTVNDFAIDLHLDISETTNITQIIDKSVKNRFWSIFKRTKKSVSSFSARTNLHSDIEKLGYLPYVKANDVDFLKFKSMIEDLESEKQYQAAFNLCIESISNNVFPEYAMLKQKDLLPLLRGQARKEKGQYIFLLWIAIILTIVVPILALIFL